MQREEKAAAFIHSSPADTNPSTPECYKTYLEWTESTAAVKSVQVLQTRCTYTCDLGNQQFPSIFLLPIYRRCQ